MDLAQFYLSRVLILMSRGSGPARMGIYISGSQHPSHYQWPQGLQTMAVCRLCVGFVPYFTILYHENHWFHLQKLQDSHIIGLFEVFLGEPQGSPSWISFDKSQEFLHGFTTGNAYLGFCEVSWQGREI